MSTATLTVPPPARECDARVVELARRLHCLPSRELDALERVLDCHPPEKVERNTMFDCEVWMNPAQMWKAGPVVHHLVPDNGNAPAFWQLVALRSYPSEKGGLPGYHGMYRCTGSVRLTANLLQHWLTLADSNLDADAYRKLLTRGGKEPGDIQLIHLTLQRLEL